MGNVVIIAGCRDFYDCAFIYDRLNLLASQDVEFGEVLSGGASGVDRCAERWAKHKEIPLRVFKADWTGLGRRAGPIRNQLMAELGDVLVAFWDNKSRGTENMINEARKRLLRVVIIDISEAKTREQQRRIIEHSLGLTYKTKPYRRHYCTIVGDEKLEAMVELGLMERGPKINQGLDMYYLVTAKGAALVGSELPSDDR